MSEIDEELDALFDKHFRDDDGIVWCISSRQWPNLKQAIKDLMCKLRGCEPEQIFNIDSARAITKGPCKWCGAAQRGEG